MMTNFYRIMVIGANWHGSDCTGLARAFRSLGHAVELIGLDHFLPKIDQSLSSRVFRKLISPFCVKLFNNHILSQISLFKPNIVLVFKGNHVQAETLQQIKRSKSWLCNFYPDVSFTCHTDIDLSSFKFYDHIFTTKTFGINDAKSQLGVNKVSFLPHGFDPHTHRPTSHVILNENLTDVSFIGTWSPHKQALLEFLSSKMMKGKITIWGAQWEKAQLSPINKHIMGYGVLGDHYAMAICSTKINLGLLSEKRKGASSGDQITSRSFHIPACGGFLLHERTEEILNYYKEDKEIACFDNSEELADKVKYYLDHDDKRLNIAKSGYERCIKENSLANRANVIIDQFEYESK